MTEKLQCTTTQDSSSTRRRVYNSVDPSPCRLPLEEEGRLYFSDNVENECNRGSDGNDELEHCQAIDNKYIPVLGSFRQGDFRVLLIPSIPLFWYALITMAVID